MLSVRKVLAGEKHDSSSDHWVGYQVRGCLYAPVLGQRAGVLDKKYESNKTCNVFKAQTEGCYSVVLPTF